MKCFKLAAAVLFMGTSVANATPLNEYNLILSGDFNVSGGSGHVEGRTFIGGNLVNGSSFAQKIDKSSTDNTVEVVGSVAINSAMHVEAGYLAYSGSLTGSTNGLCNGNGLGNGGCVKYIAGPELSDKKTSLFNSLTSESTYYAGLATSADTSIAGDSNNKTFSYTGAATDLVTFNIDTTDLANINWGLNIGNADNVLINVTGTTFTAGNAHVNGFQNFVDNVLWNFIDATELHFGDSWYGSVLALDADIYTNSNLNGAIAARSYLGNGEIHTGTWNYTPPTTVPEPSSILLMGLGITGLVIARRRHR